MKILKISLAMFSMLFSSQFYAQGCSDAGFCTIASMKPQTDSTMYKNQVKIGLAYGGADNDISVLGNYIEYNRQISDKFGIDAKITSLSQSGNNISTFGLSDLFLNANYKVKNNWRLTLGAKIPLADGNKKENNIALPMDYQASLGTFDLIFGVGYEIKKLQLALALQQPLSQNNNQFFANNFQNSAEVMKFQTTNEFKRSGDLLFRASYPISLTNNLTLTPSFLPIYHLANDKYTDALNVEKEIEGSQGLTLNGNIYLDYKLTEKSFLQLSLGAPFVTRDSRPDGLTRRFIANLEYRIKF